MESTRILVDRLTYTPNSFSQLDSTDQSYCSEWPIRVKLTKGERCFYWGLPSSPISLPPPHQKQKQNRETQMGLWLCPVSHCGNGGSSKSHLLPARLPAISEVTNTLLKVSRTGSCMLLGIHMWRVGIVYHMIVRSLQHCGPG